METILLILLLLLLFLIYAAALLLTPGPSFHFYLAPPKLSRLRPDSLHKIWKSIL